MPVILDISCSPKRKECPVGLPIEIPYIGRISSYYTSSCWYGYTTPPCGGRIARVYGFDLTLGLKLSPDFQVYKYDPMDNTYYGDGPFYILGIGVKHRRIKQWYPTRGNSYWEISVMPFIYYILDIPRFCIKNFDCVDGDFYADFHIELVLFRFLSAERVGMEIRCECYCTDYYDLEVWDFVSGEDYTIHLKPGINEIYLTNCPKIKILGGFEVKLDLRCLTIDYDWKWDWAICGRYADYEREFNRKKEGAKHYAKYFISDDLDFVWKKFPAAGQGHVLTEDLMLFDVSNYV